MDKIWIQHVAISVQNIDRSIAWYHDIFGFELLTKARHDEISATVATMRCGAVRLELFEHDHSIALPSERSAPDEDIRTQGTKHFCLGTDDISAMIDRFRREEIEIVVGPERFDDCDFVYIHDNNGILIEIMQQCKA